MLQQSQLKRNCISTPHSCIHVGLMPHRTWRLQQHRICVEILPSTRTEFPRIKQPPWAPHSSHYAMGGHHSGKTLAWWLRPFHDQKHMGSWLKKTNFIGDSEDPIQATIWLKVAHHHASHYLSHAIWECSQWFCGADNTVTNALSWDNDRSDKELTKILCSHCHSQLHRHFKIVPLPQKITSWLTLLLLRLPVKPQLVETHTRMTLGRGTATSNTATRPDLGTIFSSMECPGSSRSISWELLPWLCAKVFFCNSVMLPWLKAQSQIPSMQWLQP
jgi:hypothetical protein